MKLLIIFGLVLFGIFFTSVSDDLVYGQFSNQNTLKVSFENNLHIKDFFKIKFKKDIKNLSFESVNHINFPLIKIKKKINQYPSSSIIYNAANEVLVDLFLQKKVPFLSISKTILKIHKDSNYIKYAIKKPKNIKEILKIDNWARRLIKKKNLTQ